MNLSLIIALALALLELEISDAQPLVVPRQVKLLCSGFLTIRDTPCSKGTSRKLQRPRSSRS